MIKDCPSYCAGHQYPPQEGTCWYHPKYGLAMATGKMVHDGGGNAEFLIMFDFDTHSERIWPWDCGSQMSLILAVID